MENSEIDIEGDRGDHCDIMGEGGMDENENLDGEGVALRKSSQNMFAQQFSFRNAKPDGGGKNGKLGPIVEEENVSNIEPGSYQAFDQYNDVHATNKQIRLTSVTKDEPGTPTERLKTKISKRPNTEEALLKRMDGQIGIREDKKPRPQKRRSAAVQKLANNDPIDLNRSIKQIKTMFKDPEGDEPATRTRTGSPSVLHTPVAMAAKQDLLAEHW